MNNLFFSIWEMLTKRIVCFVRWSLTFSFVVTWWSISKSWIDMFQFCWKKGASQRQYSYRITLKVNVNCLLYVLAKTIKWYNIWYRLLQKTAFTLLVKCRLAQGSPCWLVVRSFLRHHAENVQIHRKMAIDCPIVITSMNDTLFQTRNEK